MSQTRRGETPLLSAAQPDAFLARVRTGVSPEDYRVIEAMSHALPQIVESIAQERMTMRKLRHLLFGAKTEQTDRVCPPASPPSLIPPVPKPKRQGHGRIKATDYTGARWVHVAHCMHRHLRLGRRTLGPSDHAAGQLCRCELRVHPVALLPAMTQQVGDSLVAVRSAAGWSSRRSGIV